jgi:hypothetical protein
MEMYLKQLAFYKEQLNEKDHEIETLKFLIENMTDEVTESKKQLEENKVEKEQKQEDTKEELRQF